MTRIREHLRSYDVIVRFGGDEFVCSVSGQDTTAARERFDEISIQPREGPAQATFSVGLAERREGETLDVLIERADKAMTQTKTG